MIISGKNINLRSLKEDDAVFLAINANNRAISRFTFLPYPYNIDSALSFIKTAKKNIKLGTAFELGIEFNGEIVGVIGLLDVSKQHKKAALGFWLGKKYWRQGIMTEAIILMKNFAFKELKLKKISAVVLAGNKASENILRKNNFIFDGRERHFAILRNKSYDGIFFSILSSDK
ncbi:MAG: GNAT family N-acetyltransferase [Patescibacteria group bacterium]|nr:GNAT family N-acetyltransferase [Patescibacteria group bacterium]